MLEFAYGGNILFVTPVLYILLFREDGAELVFGGLAPRTSVARTVVTCMWASIVICSIAGVKWEHTFVGLLVFQAVYKVLFLTGYVLPRLVQGRTDEIPWVLTALFTLGAVGFPFMIWYEYAL